MKYLIGLNPISRQFLKTGTVKTLEKQSALRRQNRSEYIRVALVGYTNVGKTTIMNLLSKSENLAENKLFATLDTTVRKMVLERTPILLSDTVGFIRKLPHNLVASFKSTLKEVLEADLILITLDISSSQLMDHFKTIKEVLTARSSERAFLFKLFNKGEIYETSYYICNYIP